jgi:hypothetical protein
MTSCTNRVLSTYAMCGQNSVFIFKPGDTYSNHSALKRFYYPLTTCRSIRKKLHCSYNVSWLSFISNVWIRNKFAGKSKIPLTIFFYGASARFRTMAFPLLWAFARRGYQPKAQPLSGESRLYRCPASLSKSVRHGWPFQQRGWSYTIPVWFHVATGAPVIMGSALPTLWMWHCCIFPYKHINDLVVPYNLAHRLRLKSEKLLSGCSYGRLTEHLD